MSHLETVKVKHADGYMIINIDDFNPEIHELYNEEDALKLNRDEEYVFGKNRNQQNFKMNSDDAQKKQLPIEKEQQPAPIQEEKKPVQRKRATSKNEDNSRK